MASVIAKGTLRPAIASRLVGRLRYAASQTFGRVATPAAKILQLRADTRGGELPATPPISMALRRWDHFLAEAPPRILRPPSGLPPLCLFTDGALEQGVATMGAVSEGVLQSLLGTWAFVMSFRRPLFAEIGL